MKSSPLRQVQTGQISVHGKVNAFILLKVDKLVDRVLTWLPTFNEIKLMFAQ